MQGTNLPRIEIKTHIKKKGKKYAKGANKIVLHLTSPNLETVQPIVWH